MALNNNNYVKFVRGSATAWAALTEKSPETLYFITTYGDNNEVLKTEMYLGEQLISDGAIEQAPVNVQLALKELTDVDIADSIVLEDGMFLGYNATTGQWEPRTQTEVTVDTMTGASSSTAGAAGLVPAPEAGDEKKVLTGDGKWTELNIPDTTTLENKVSILISEDANKSARNIAAEEVAKIVADADEAYNTLKEISDWITSHPADVAEINSKITDIEKELYNEVPRVDENGEPVVDETTNEPIIDKVSKVGNLEEDLKKAQEEIAFTATEVGQLETLLGAQKNDDGALTGLTAVDQINDIFTALNPVLDESGNVTSFKELEKIEALEDLLGVTENEDGTIEITSAPIGNLDQLILYQEKGEKADSLVKAINILTEQMTWGELSE